MNTKNSFVISGFEALFFQPKNIRTFPISKNRRDHAPGGRNLKLSKSQQHELFTQVGLDLFKQAALLEIQALPAWDAKVSVASEQATDSIFHILAHFIGQNEDFVIDEMNRYIKRHIQELQELAQSLAPLIPFDLEDEKFPFEFLLKLLKSSQSFKILIRHFSEEDRYIYLDILRLINFIRCQIASVLFHLDIEIHDICIKTDDSLFGTAYTRGVVHAYFNPNPGDSRVILALGTRKHGPFGDDGIYQFIEPVLFEKKSKRQQPLESN